MIYEKLSKDGYCTPIRLTVWNTMGRAGYDTSGLNKTVDIETPGSIASEEPSTVEETHPFHQLRKPFLEVVMAAFNETYIHWDMSATSLQSSTDSTTWFTQESIDDKTRKRGHSPEFESTDGLEDKQMQEAIRTKRRAQGRVGPCFACPFAKRDPVRYRDCYRYFLTRIRDVKQHLTRCHRKPIYCPICKETFEDEDDRDTHVMSNVCSLRSSTTVEGITEKQKKELSQRVSSRMPQDQQWYAVYDILFAPHSRPRTPYVNRELSEEMYVFRDFVTVEGPTLLAEYLDSKGVVTWKLPNEERDLAAFQENILAEGLDRIFDKWTRAHGAHGMTERLADVPQSPVTSQSLDSGISMQDHHTSLASTRMDKEMWEYQSADLSSSSAPAEQSHMKCGEVLPNYDKSPRQRQRPVNEILEMSPDRPPPNQPPLGEECDKPHGRPLFRESDDLSQAPKIRASTPAPSSEPGELTVFTDSTEFDAFDFDIYWRPP
ncbi:hypothetical protein F5Y19DRAFT_453427 [Xylariaceae sp. FL1651]|nr:hypothetical protein F5Y19DRAFT_453427 [Xylariaceae sp. FL1651]